MKKIISLFQRNYDGDRLIRDEVVPGAEWVLAGEGIATRKYDGSCCAVIGGEYFKRYDVKQGKQPPAGFIPAQEADPVTGHWPGWVLVTVAAADKWFLVAWDNWRAGHSDKIPEDGTYEAVGPHFQSNPEHFDVDMLVRHGMTYICDVPRTFDGLKEFLGKQDIEGIVWHHPDGRMVKIKKKDFGWKR